MTLTAAQAALARAMPEAELQEQVRVLCRDLGLLYYHVHRAQHSPAGFPDCVIVGMHGVVCRELKREKGDPSPAQRTWLAHLGHHGLNVGVWRPSDLLSGAVAAHLAVLGALPAADLATLTPRRTSRR